MPLWIISCNKLNHLSAKTAHLLSNNLQITIHVIILRIEFYLYIGNYLDFNHLN